MRRFAMILAVVVSALLPWSAASAAGDPGHAWPAKAWPAVHTKGKTVEARGTSWEYQEGTRVETRVKGRLRVNKKNLCGWVRLEYSVLGSGVMRETARNCGSKWKGFHFAVDKKWVLYVTVQACEGTKSKPGKRCSPVRYLPGFKIDSADDWNKPS
ncbi:hypothetical protein Acor_46720 [Acrocarpospora corrugata]|uniref:Secreted protein n=1 Tax=Acrocarpospora corrugata TaxID=35763 RepID=A0A5M3W1L8_9ACTN|nr:hypothetical protein [Acrocarpospora corrugata]GES02606.1 hypothetical protein Acor_46720 [Acrocarpospora corrugata]